MHLLALLTIPSLLRRAARTPQDAPALPSIVSVNTSEIGIPCGGTIGDCPSLTCIPLSQNCTIWAEDNYPYIGPPGGCLGTCQFVNLTEQHIYTKCGGWGLYDDCNEAVEFCTDDPRNQGCGPSCDGNGICLPTIGSSCGFDSGLKCAPGLECFHGTPGEWTNGVPSERRGCVEWTLSNGTQEKWCGGKCLPLRFGSDRYEKTKLEERWTEEFNGRQREDPDDE